METNYEGHVQFVTVVQADPAFAKWVDGVSPRVSGIQQVWVAELFFVLKLLWEIYQILKGRGFFSAWFQTRKVRIAMRGKTVAEKEEALSKVRNDLLVQTA